MCANYLQIVFNITTIHIFDHLKPCHKLPNYTGQLFCKFQITETGKTEILIIVTIYNFF